MDKLTINTKVKNSFSSKKLTDSPKFMEWMEKRRAARKKKRMANNQQTIFGWHSLEDYKNYIAYIEAEAKKHGVEVSGNRVYFGHQDPVNGSKKGQLTYFFTPTYLDEATGKHEAFGTFTMSDDGKPVKVHEAITNKKSLTEGGGGESLLWNHSVLCPPVCN